jgi:hypothetical protein
MATTIKLDGTEYTFKFTVKANKQLDDLIQPKVPTDDGTEISLAGSGMSVAMIQEMLGSGNIKAMLLSEIMSILDVQGHTADSFFKILGAIKSDKEAQTELIKGLHDEIADNNFDVGL